MNLPAVLTHWGAAERRKEVFLRATALSPGLEAKPVACCEVLLSCRRAPGRALRGVSEAASISAQQEWIYRATQLGGRSTQAPTQSLFQGVSFLV